MVLLSTFSLTVLVDLTVAIQVGVVLAALLFMRRMAEVSEVRSVTDTLGDLERMGFEAENPDVVLPEGTEVFEVAGSFFFGAAQRFSEALAEIQRQPRVVILRMRDVFSMDATGLRALDEVHARFSRQGITLLLSGVRPQPLTVMRKAGSLERFGEENVLDSFRAASVRAWAVVDEDLSPEESGPSETPSAP